MTPAQLSLVSRKTPDGLANPVAILAWSLLWPTPIEHHSRVRSRTRRWTSRARASGSFESTAMNASSHPATSTCAGKDRRAAITSLEAARYASASTGRNTASGQRLYAVRSGIAEWIP